VAWSVWDQYQKGFIRELYFRGDRSDAVLILKCVNMDYALDVLNSLPLVKAGLITFDLIHLVPYTGYSRLFHTTDA
jgi:hypothetical protein